MSKICLVLSFLLSFNVFAVTFKLGVLAPEGTSWAKNLKEMAEKIKEETQGEVEFKFYFGAVQGDERDVFRKMRINQLHGGIFTGKSLGEINGDIRLMEVPFTFEGDTLKASNTFKKMSTYFDQKLSEKKFVGLGFYELGEVYFVSQSKVQSIEELKGVKIWAWEGDDLVFSLINTLELISIPLALPDVLSSLSTGIVEAAYAPPLGIVALQWNTKVKYLINFPLAYSIGAFLVSEKLWKKLSKDLQQKVKKVCSHYIQLANKTNKKENADSLEMIKSMGVEFLNFSSKDIEKSKELRSKILTNLMGKMFSKEGLKKFEESLN